MSDIRYVAALPREQLRAALRRGAFDPEVRVFAEDLLAAETRIDLLAVDGHGRVVVVVISDEGKDREAITQALAHRAWVRPRLGDWLQLAPNLPVAADSPVVAWLLSPNFAPETLAAAKDLGSDVIELSTLRSVRNGSSATVLVEKLSTSPEPIAPRGHSLPTDSSFRSGLSQQDLGLTAEEVSDFSSF